MPPTLVPPPDLLFLSPTIIPGSEPSTSYVSDVLVSNGLIARIAPDLDSSTASHVKRIDGRGCILCPGFIDLHAHSDLYLLTEPAHEAKISQGCTVSLWSSLNSRGSFSDDRQETLTLSLVPSYQPILTTRSSPNGLYASPGYASPRGSWSRSARPLARRRPKS